LDQPNGLLFLSTINRTPSSYLFTILLAEHILKWVPTETHDHEKYITPSELQNYLSRAGCDVLDFKGIEYKVLENRWGLVGGNLRRKRNVEATSGCDLEMNYIACARRKGRE
jgi:2-polyprenyl-6-hydroxyphenyl methylase/3-demethylubiquinone-9 3-methyltransferase